MLLSIPGGPCPIIWDTWSLGMITVYPMGLSFILLRTIWKSLKILYMTSSLITDKLWILNKSIFNILIIKVYSSNLHTHIFMFLLHLIIGISKVKADKSNHESTRLIIRSHYSCIFYCSHRQCLFVIIIMLFGN